ncbi:MAG: hypothetical protein OWR62_05040 [Sulfobacillus thermotolerans]|uniref:Uncharacterized protein n=1 Tax=Sulfobacillus thermotolerans TaxID=338644 RepID=A0ABM6RRP0_9FIRM|nr:hypothetical protein BXT84_09250 [Sulfobacillus thermotolerans]MCY0907730.1 hypothetical protein [Sulfobacillus thermotolerans]
MTKRWALVTASGIGAISAAALYIITLRYESWAMTWHQGSVFLGFGPFQIFYAQVFPRFHGLSDVTMGIGWGVVFDPLLISYGVYRLLSRYRSD